MKNISIGLGELGIIGGIASAIYFGWQCVKLYKTAKKLDMTLDEMSNKQPVEIESAVLDKAVERAVDREVHKAVTETTNRIRNQMQADMRAEIRKDVNAAYDEIRKDVSEKVAVEVAKIDQEALKREVTKRAEDKIVQQFDGNLDILTGKLNHSLGNVVKIYDGILDTVNGNRNNRGNGNGLRLMLD